MYLLLGHEGSNEDLLVADERAVDLADGILGLLDVITPTAPTSPILYTE